MSRHAVVEVMTAWTGGTARGREQGAEAARRRATGLAQLEHRREGPRSSRFRGCAALAVVAASLLLAACVSLPPSSAEFELAAPLTNPEWVLEAESAAGLTEATAVMCVEVPCLEAWDSDHARYLRFETTGDAAEHANAADDATMDRYIVIDYSDKNTPQSVRDDIEMTVLLQMPPGHAPWGF
ncbi:hypothetical protein [Agrococcus sp. Ld7]|uniref:hypothetical protein n=1 Tax=Agrococcus sp. Ld7 TaxID=649148 RepID=UPI0038679E97